MMVMPLRVMFVPSDMSDGFVAVAWNPLMVMPSIGRSGSPSM